MFMLRSMNQGQLTILGKVQVFLHGLVITLPIPILQPGPTGLPLHLTMMLETTTSIWPILLPALLQEHIIMQVALNTVWRIMFLVAIVPAAVVSGTVPPMFQAFLQLMHLLCQMHGSMNFTMTIMEPMSVSLLK